MKEDTNVAQPLVRTKKCEEKTVRKKYIEFFPPTKF